MDKVSVTRSEAPLDLKKIMMDGALVQPALSKHMHGVGAMHGRSQHGAGGHPSAYNNDTISGIRS